MKYEDLTERIIGCAMKVHSTLGNGFQEVIYQRCLAIEMDKAEFEYERELEMPIFYEGIEVVRKSPLSSTDGHSLPAQDRDRLFKKGGFGFVPLTDFSLFSPRSMFSFFLDPDSVFNYIFNKKIGDNP